MYRQLLKNGWAGFLISGLLMACSQNGGQHHDMNHDSKGTMQDSTLASLDTASLISIASAVSDDGKTQVQLFAQDSLRTGYQNLYFKLTDQTGKPLEKAELQVTPQMNMGMMVHGAPVLQPKEAVNGIFKAGVAFIMPSSEASGHTWVIGVDTKENRNTSHTKLPVNVGTAQKTTTLAFDAGSEGRFFLSLEDVRSLQSGKRTLSFLLNKVDKDQFPAADGYELALTAKMPDMGHGSKADHHATSTGEGEYRGEVDFSMPGLWELEVEVLKDGKKVSMEPIVFQVNLSQ